MITIHHRLSWITCWGQKMMSKLVDTSQKFVILGIFILDKVTRLRALLDPPPPQDGVSEFTGRYPLLYGGASFFPPAINVWTAFTVAKVKDSQKDHHLCARVVRIFCTCIFELHRHLSRWPCRITNYKKDQIHDLHCPLQKGIVYYYRDNTIFEHNIHSSRKREVRSHAAHWASRIQLTVPSSHKSLSWNIRRSV